MDPTLKHSLTLYVFLVLGVFLAVAPWTPVWYEATVLLLPTRFGAPAQQGWVRGLVTAIGVMDLLAAGAAGRELLRLATARRPRE